MKRIDVNPASLSVCPEKLEPGDLVYVGLYVQRPAYDEDYWWLSPRDGYVGIVREHPVADSSYAVDVPPDEVNVMPLEPMPIGDEYASLHPLLVQIGERHAQISGVDIILHRTVELITPDEQMSRHELGAAQAA